MYALWRPTRYAPTPYTEVNAVLAELLEQVQGALGAQLVGVYLSGSLALGDFDPKASDIDVVVVTTGALDDARVAALRTVHARLESSGSPWAGKMEVVYVARDALAGPPDMTLYPQVEKARGFFLDRLEDGWLSQCYIVREHGITLAGPDPERLFAPVDADAMRRGIAGIAEMWRREAQDDPSWLEWLRIRRNQAFVVLTLCRLLYTLETGAVASKPAAARWAQRELGETWTGLIERARAGKEDYSAAPEDDVVETVALVELVYERFRQWNR
jgi:hypothetical protein